MADAPPARPGLFSGLAKILHLHQLPQGPKNTTTKGDAAQLVSPTRMNTPDVRKTLATTPLSPTPERAPISTSASTQKTIPIRAPIPAPIPAPTPTHAPTLASPPPRTTIISPAPAPRQAAPAHPTIPAAGISSMGSTHPKWPISHELNPPHTHAQSGVSKGIIVTDYDRILDLVKARHPIKLDEIARLLSLKEELVAQELQTLEDNGLVEVKYPAFGEPLIYFKTPEA